MFDRDKFEIVIERCIALGHSILMRCSDDAVDVDDAGLRLTLDIVSKVAPARFCLSSRPKPCLSYSQS